jgi:hypothetical protein
MKKKQSARDMYISIPCRKKTYGHWWSQAVESDIVSNSVLGIRIRRIRMFLGLLDPDPDLLVTGTDPDPSLLS